MIVIGIGARSGVTAEEVLAAVDAVLPPDAADVRLATLATRAAEPGVAEAAATRGWGLIGYSATELAQIRVPSPSDAVAGHVGTASVAEAAALMDGGELVVAKTVHGRVTVAVSVSGQGREHRSEAAADREGASQRGTSEERTDRGGGLGIRARSGAPRGSEPWTE